MFGHRPPDREDVAIDRYVGPCISLPLQYRFATIDDYRVKYIEVILFLLPNLFPTQLANHQWPICIN